MSSNFPVVSRKTMRIYFILISVKDVLKSCMSLALENLLCDPRVKEAIGQVEETGVVGSFRCDKEPATHHGWGGNVG